MGLNQQQANNILGQYAPRIASLLGGSVPGNLRVQVLPAAEYARRYPNTGAYSIGGNVIVVPDNTPDPARIIAYEAAHQMAAGAGVSTTMGEHGLLGGRPGKASEAVAGVVTNKLGLTPPDWQPNARQARFMNLTPSQFRSVGQDLESGSYTSIRDSIGGDVAQPNGPRQTTTTGRNRNTVINNASRAAPAVSPSFALQLGDQSAQNQYDFLTRLAQLRQEKANLRGAFVSAKGAAREQRIGEATAYEADALQRGIVGSSSDLGQRAGAVTNEAEAIAAARAARGQGMLGVAQGKLDAYSSYYRTQASIDAQRRAEQAMMAVDEFGDNINGNTLDYNSILADIQNQKAGSGAAGPVRPRVGVTPPINRPSPYDQRPGGPARPYAPVVPRPYDQRNPSYAAPPTNPRIARLLREGY